MRIETQQGLHYIEGMPSALEYAYRGVTFVASVVCVGLLIGILRARADIHRGLWWIAMACFIVVGVKAIVAIERWVVPITVESFVSSLALPCLLYGVYLRVRDGTIGR
jgi:heme A synthase